MLQDEIDWPEWIEELFDNDQEPIPETKDFKWEFLEENTLDNDIEYA